MAAFPGDGFSDLRRRLRIPWVWAVRLRLRRALFQAEAELGWLGWEQVDFFDEQSNAAVEKIQEFENTQATLQNTSAELSGRKAALDEELAREKAVHDEAQAALAAERAPIAARLQQAEATHRLKLGASERFERALEEIASLEKRLEARSLSFMNVQYPTLEIRTEARNVSDQLARLAGERTLVLGDKVNAAHEAAVLESGIAQLRGELQRLTGAGSAAHDALASAAHRLNGQMSLLKREQKQSTLHMSHLDREKQQPYRFIGACLADHGIAPANQPQILGKVLALRERDLQLTQTLADLRAACAAADTGILIAFYLFIAALLIAICALAAHFF